MTSRIYLDYAATTPLHPQVFEKMKPWLSEGFGNASSLYLEGRKAKESIDQAREILSDSLGCLFGEVLFTGSGTESANLAVIGTALAHKGSRKTIVFGAAEHHCVLHTRPILERLGFNVVIAPVDRKGMVDKSVLESLMTDDVLLVSVMHANNELGTIDSPESVAKIAGNVGAMFHCDAVQTYPLINGDRWTINELGADLVTLSAHKLGGPKGVGALFVRGGTDIEPVIAGGGQERDMRAGTENVAAIVGFGEAVTQRLRAKSYSEKCAMARNAFLETLREQTDAFVLSVEGAETLAGHLHLRFPGLSTESMLITLDRLKVSASSGAACSSGSVEPSHVLKACGWTDKEVSEGLRFTFGDLPVERAQEAAKRTALAAAQVAQD